MRFEWDAVNTKKLAARGITASFVESVILACGHTAIVKADNPLRFTLDVQVGAACFRIVFSVVGENAVRVVTAHRIRCRKAWR